MDFNPCMDDYDSYYLDFDLCMDDELDCPDYIAILGSTLSSVLSRYIQYLKKKNHYVMYSKSNENWLQQMTEPANKLTF